MKYRKLRIAWSVAWGLLAVLLCVLWVRSYWRVETISGNVGSHCILLTTFKGKLGLGSTLPNLTANVPLHVTSESIPADNLQKDVFVEMQGPTYRAIEFRWVILPNGWQTEMPCWFPFLATIAFGVAPWLRCRFSLRTLLIATTLVAVGLGMIMWMLRAG